MTTTVYRDYGALSGESAPNNEFTLEKFSQVYHDTHQYNNDRHGWERLPYMYRSFISFTYGGKHIEDFDLIATTSGDRMERDAYASFDDLTSTYDTIQGQFFWGSYFKSNSITFDLATDGITQDKLDEFKRWFRPGVIKELILAEHPNRAIMARVSQPPQFKLLPFEHPIQIQIGDEVYNTKTTIYRGEIILDMVMDEPFWYAKQNILGIQNTNEGYYDESWVDANNNTVEVKNTPDALKIIFEDHIPLGSVAQTFVFLGGGYVSSARIGGADMTSAEENSFGITLPAAETVNLYYAGTAPSPVTIFFKLTPIMDNSTYYITSPYNKLGHPELPYNTIQLVSTKQHNFCFTVPDIYSSYNQVIQLVDSLVHQADAWLTIREYIRNNIKHAAVRAWANRVLDKYDNVDGTGIIEGNTETIKADIKLGLSYLFKDELGLMLPAEFEFNSKTGHSYGKFTYRSATASADSNTDWTTYGIENLIESEEDVGDMIKSNYLILDERNVLSDKYQIQAWQEDHPDYAYYVQHDVPNGLQSLRFEFKNMYL